MTPLKEIRSLASKQLRDYDARTPGTVFAESDFKLAVEDAYLLQIETVRLRTARGESIAGFKIGCVSPVVRSQLGIEHAVFGHVFQSEVRSSHASLAGDEFCDLGIEGEFAVMLAEDVPEPDVLRDCPQRIVGAVFPVIELHNYLFRGPAPSASEIVANNALHAGIVVPEQTISPGSFDRLDIRVVIGDRIDESASVNPLETLHELACRLAAFDIGLTAGQILLGGSPLPLYPVGPKEHIRVECPGVAVVTASVQ